MSQRYIVAYVARGAVRGYVVYDRRAGVVADGLYLTLADAQWAAEQRERQAAKQERSVSA